MFPWVRGCDGEEVEMSGFDMLGIAFDQDSRDDGAPVAALGDCTRLALDMCLFARY